MKVAAPLWVLISALLASAASGRGASGPAPASVSRQDYVRVEDWARSRQFTVRLLERDRTLELSNRWTRLAFNLDPHRDLRRAWINGVQVWLAFPLSCQNGVTRISRIDLRETLEPALAPPANPSGNKIKTICLDPGHGGRDPGFRVGSNEEKKYTLLLAAEVRDQLKRAGFNVVLTRSTDVYVSREDRSDLARQRGADLFVSLHFNAIEEGRSVVKGLQIYCCTPAGATSSNAGGEGDTGIVTGNRNDERNMALAYQMQKALVNGLPVEDRGVKRARFEVLRLATMPAILIEGGFMSHPAEGRKIFDPAYRQQMARAIVGGILAYKQAVKG